ncbi:MAG: HAD-IIB family hydrolase [Bacteroidota bacterium]
MSRKLLFTDLDGTLLELDSYSPELSIPAIRKLQQHQIPVIFCSSKTKAEQLELRAELGIKDPFIVENGSAIFIPHGYFNEVLVDHVVKEDYVVVELGKSADDILSTIQEYRSKFPLDLMGYEDLSLPEIMEITGLDQDGAREASTRDYSETFIKGNFEDVDFHHFCLAMDLRGMACVRGSKYVTIMGKYADKGKAVKILSELFAVNWKSKVSTAAVGDSGNDQPMLEAVDQPFLVKKPSNQWHEMEVNSLQQVDGVGPIGWQIVVDDYLLSDTAIVQ